MQKHIVIFSDKDINRSHLMDTLVGSIRVPLYGFVTRTTECNSNGYHDIYMYKASDALRKNTLENYLGSCNGLDRTIKISTFNVFGIECLKARNDGIIIMDELGFMEASAFAFCEEVNSCFEGNIPILASAKNRMDIDFLRKIRSHPNVIAYDLTADNEIETYNNVKEHISRWNKDDRLPNGI